MSGGAASWSRRAGQQLFGVPAHKQRAGCANFVVADPPLMLVLIEKPGAAATGSRVIASAAVRPSDAREPSPADGSASARRPAGQFRDQLGESAATDPGADTMRQGRASPW
jgi:hypothetical protein